MFGMVRRFRKLIKADTSDYSEQKYRGCCVEPCPDMASIHCDLFLKESIVALVTLVPSLVACVLIIRDIIQMNYEQASPVNHDQAIFLIG